MSRSRARTLAAVTAAGLLASVVMSSPSGAGPAAAATDTEGWYHAQLGYDDLHAQGYTGEGVTIAVIEEGLDPEAVDLQGANVEYVPLPAECEMGASKADIDHGTHMASLIVGQGGADKIQGVAPDAKLIVLQTPPAGYTPDHAEWPGECDPGEVLLSGRTLAAADMGADIVSLSATGGSEPAAQAVGYLMLTQTAYFVASGNSSVMSSVSANYEGTSAVGSVDATGNVPEWSGRGEDLSLTAPGTGAPYRNVDTGELSTADGTSVSTPIAAGTMALGMQAWPDATTHQLMQSLARNTVQGGGELERVNDDVGYGSIDPTAFVAADPTQYPDEPPFAEGKESGPGPWWGAADVLMGMPTNSIMGNITSYEEGAGPDPAVVEWLPEEHADALGAAPDSALWENGGASGGDEEFVPDAWADYVDEDENETSAAGNHSGDSSVAVWPIILIAAASLGLIALIVVVIVFARRSSQR